MSLGDSGPWSASSGPWRAVGVRKQRLVFTPTGSSTTPGTTAAVEPGTVDGGKVDVTVESLSDGSYVVELLGERHMVEGAEVDDEGALTATVDGRRVDYCGVV